MFSIFVDGDGEEDKLWVTRKGSSIPVSAYTYNHTNELSKSFLALFKSNIK